MDVHKPKPIRSWRELLTEIGVIVLSVCIALAAEQAVEWAHWRNEVSDARNALRTEMADSYNRFVARRIAIEPCIARQLKEADAILVALEDKRAPGKFTTFHQGSGALLIDADWESERASQVLTHFPRAELALMGRYYAMLPVFTAWAKAEGDAWRQLSALQRPLAGITTSDLMRLRAEYEIAKATSGLIIRGVDRQLRRGKELGLPDPIVDPDLVKSFCTMTDDDYGRFIATSQAARP